VTQQAVERALGKLLTDENFRERFFENPEAASWEAGLASRPSSSRRTHACLDIQQPVFARG
jgi:hypothetical protein